MDKVKQVGKILGKRQRETSLNARRGAENFPAPEITVKDFNKLFDYKKTFMAHSDGPVKINVGLKEITTPCTVNPPTTDVWCRAKFGIISYPTAVGQFTTCLAYPVTMLDNNGSIDPDTELEKEFILNADGSITVPETGCYGIEWSSGAYGVGYFENHRQIATFYHNDRVVHTLTKQPSGFIAILGPWIWVFPAITHIYKVMEAKAGDTFKVTLSDDGINECYPWWGCLRGFFVYQDTTEVRIDLIAVAEGV
jgi:hypothetical protein